MESGLNLEDEHSSHNNGLIVLLTGNEAIVISSLKGITFSY